jgi:hypothetical protein
MSCSGNQSNKSATPCTGRLSREILAKSALGAWKAMAGKRGTEDLKKLEYLSSPEEDSQAQKCTC